MDYVLCQGCPCGHVFNRKATDPSIASQLADPKKLDAPIVSSKECPECKEDAKRDDYLYDLFD